MKEVINGLVAVAASEIDFPDLKLYEFDVNTLSLENLAGGTYKSLRLGGLKTGIVAGETVLFQAYDVGTGSYTTFATLAAHATDPTFKLSNITMEGTWLASGVVTLPAVTLGGAVAGGDQAFTNVGDMTFAAGSILASGSTNGNTLLLRANDTTFITLTTGATDVCELAGVTLSGNTLVANGGTIGQAAGPLLTFDDTLDYLTLTGGWFKISSTGDAYLEIMGVGARVDANTPSGRILLGRDIPSGTGVAAGDVAGIIHCQSTDGSGNDGDICELQILTSTVTAGAVVSDWVFFTVQGAAIGTTVEGMRLQGKTLMLPSGGALQVNSVQVVGARIVDARIDDTPNSGDATTDGIIAALQSMAQTHGLMAAA